MTEDMTETIGGLWMSVLLVQATHAAEMSHQVLKCAAVMRRQCTEQTVQSRFTLLGRLQFYASTKQCHQQCYQCFTHSVYSMSKKSEKGKVQYLL